LDPPSPGVPTLFGLVPMECGLPVRWIPSGKNAEGSQSLEIYEYVREGDD